MLSPLTSSQITYHPYRPLQARKLHITLSVPYQLASYISPL